MQNRRLRLHFAFGKKTKFAAEAMETQKNTFSILCFNVPIAIRMTNLFSRQGNKKYSLSYQYHRSLSFDLVVEIINAFGIPNESCHLLFFAAKSSIPGRIISAS